MGKKLKTAPDNFTNQQLYDFTPSQLCNFAIVYANIADVHTGNGISITGIVNSYTRNGISCARIVDSCINNEDIAMRIVNSLIKIADV
jgi:hypothetical protein